MYRLILSCFLVSFLFSLGAGIATADISIEKTNFQNDNWIETTETLIIRFNQFPQPDEGQELRDLHPCIVPRHAALRHPLELHRQLPVR